MTKKVNEAQRWVGGLLREKTKSHIEIVDQVGVLRKFVFPTKFNYDISYKTKDLPRSERHESLPDQICLIFLERSESML
ncbi:unnamed protein product [Brachionus calyciflorus]|uniref:Uncharacterized protein n=1 Tax=Brachionus calyciflorus TaxID=104777 RepID=A0A814DQI7_9BILA|nr:unnamed protein product [Brachionus calyciflorus]